MRKQSIVLAAAIILAPLGTQGANLAVRWAKGYHDQEDEALRDTIAAFEQDTGKQATRTAWPQ